MTDHADSGGGPSEHRVHADTFEYTREGLRTRAPLPLATGRHHRIVLVRPKRQMAVRGGAHGFPHDSAFPLPGTLSLFWTFAPDSAAFARPAAGAVAPTGRCYQVFGHTSASGDEAHNKQLSDRRAKVGASLLLADAEILGEVADEEQWGPEHRQAMLRTLGCDPGPIDGDIGPRTETALALFQDRYNRSIYHRRAPSRRPTQTLEVTGVLDDATDSALVEAFVVAHGAHIPSEHLHPSHPMNGCSEYNPLSDNAADNRRLSLIAHPEVPEHHENAPCRAGDEQACAIVGEDRYRCMWFRYHVTEDPPDPVRLFDPRWLWLGDDRYLLSVLTTADADTEIEFEVFDAPERVRGSDDITGSWLDHRRGETLRSSPIFGVVQVLWRSGLQPSDDAGRPAFEQHPVFRARHAGSDSHCFSPWPETTAVRLLVGAVADHDSSLRGHAFRLWTTDGAYDRVVPLGDATRSSAHQVVLEFPGVPLDARVCLSWGSDANKRVELLSDVEVLQLLDNCSEGRVCTDIDPDQPPPPAPSMREQDRHWDAINDLLDGNDA